MNNSDKDIEEFKSLLSSNKHYSEALVNLLIKKLDENCKFLLIQPLLLFNKLMILFLKIQALS